MSHGLLPLCGGICGDLWALCCPHFADTPCWHDRCCSTRDLTGYRSFRLLRCSSTGGYHCCPAAVSCCGLSCELGWAGRSGGNSGVLHYSREGSGNGSLYWLGCGNSCLWLGGGRLVCRLGLSASYDRRHRGLRSWLYGCWYRCRLDFPIGWCYSWTACFTSRYISLGYARSCRHNRWRRLDSGPVL